LKFFDNYEIGVTMPSAIFKVAVTTISVSDDIRAFDGTVKRGNIGIFVELNLKYLEISYT